MDFNEYQKAAGVFALYKDSSYPWVAIGEEVGELQGKYAKTLRGDKPLDTQAVKGELGDVLWNVARIASHLGLSLQDVAAHNIDKLLDRQQRDVIKGDGDAR